MAIASRDHASSGGETGEHFDVSAMFMQLFGAVCSVPTVDRVAIDHSDDYVDLWILLGDEDESQEELIYRHLQAYRTARGRPSVDAHVVTASEGPAAFPTRIPVVFERA
jgi:hypothetical protein